MNLIFVSYYSCKFLFKHPIEKIDQFSSTYCSGNRDKCRVKNSPAFVKHALQIFSLCYRTLVLSIRQVDKPVQ